jgi:hypothetical protein
MDNKMVSSDVAFAINCLTSLAQRLMHHLTSWATDPSATLGEFEFESRVGELID